MNSVDVSVGSGANASTGSEEFFRFGHALTAITGQISEMCPKSDVR